MRVKRKPIIFPPRDGKMYECKYCDYFAMVESVEEHIKSRHPNKRIDYKKWTRKKSNK